MTFPGLKEKPRFKRIYTDDIFGGSVTINIAGEFASAEITGLSQLIGEEFELKRDLNG